MEQQSSAKLKKVFWVLIAVGVLIVIYAMVRGDRLLDRNTEEYQAVFLDDNQVYFGKLDKFSKDFWRLTDIYYLKANTVQKDEFGETPKKIDLIKLGAELHAPKDEMIINKQHVIFYEQVGDNSEIMKMIQKDKAQ